jgi:phosphoserine phosphatase RsbX
MKAPPIEWGVAARTLGGETDSGDRHLVESWSDGALLAVVDGLGHGAEAALAADLAVRTVERYAREPLTEIVGRCHKGLLRTRGVALSLASWDGGGRVLTWIGVGNVEGVLLHADSEARAVQQRLVLRGGAVGVRLPALLVSKVPVPAGGLLLLATDGIAGGFDQEVEASGPPQLLADRILARHNRGTDDAMVLVARLAG